jgi:hypothetical protein
MIQITRTDHRVRLRIPPATLEIRELPNVAHQPVDISHMLSCRLYNLCMVMVHYVYAVILFTLTLKELQAFNDRLQGLSTHF